MVDSQPSDRDAMKVRQFLLFFRPIALITDAPARVLRSASNVDDAKTKSKSKTACAEANVKRHFQNIWLHKFPLLGRLPRKLKDLMFCQLCATLTRKNKTE